MKKVVIVAAKRTPVGCFGGSLKDFSATQLGAVAIKAAVEAAGISGDLVDEVYMGCVMQGNLGQAPARQAAKFAGLPDKVCATTVNKVCASGMKAIMQGAQSIALGDADIVVAGGMESMSNVPFYNANVRWGNKYGNISLIDGIAKDGLQDVYHNYPMGNAGELCAQTYNITREEQDAYAISSYKRSQAAIEAGLFVNEIAPVEVPQKKGDPIKITKDEEPYNVFFDKIPSLRPAFTKDGTITAANASTMNDGASAVVLMSEEKANELGLTPIARIVSYADAEQAPEWFTTTPTLVVNKALAKAGISKDVVDYYELNEAFSVVAIANARLLEIDAEKVNVNGGAVALGHPLGSSGCRIVTTLINVLAQRNAKIGVAGICNGGGGGSAIVIEKI